MREQVIEVQHLTKKFGTFEALKDVSFTVNKGDVFGFLGPNGAGKSTTIRCMLSLIRPDSGSIRIFGKSLAGNRSAILARTGSIIEKPDFYKYLSAFKNLEIFSRISGAPATKREIYTMLDFVGLNGREKDRVAGFSHGMKQRLGIAQTLLHNPDLIVLDEPTTGLDPQGIIDMRNLILRLRNEHNKTVLLSSHNLSEIELIANRMVIINKGRSVIEGAVGELLNSEELVAQIEVDYPEQARNFLEKTFPGVLLASSGADGQLQLATTKKQVAAINSALVQNGIAVYSLEAKRKLEDYFIKIVNNGHVVSEHL
ncbi:MAG: ABC transporter ATP-binding protein [Lewinellaceae bacterium]|nr:ABC transporter ATP-binding protein [Lewinellaceae bacterium]